MRVQALTAATQLHRVKKMMNFRPATLEFKRLEIEISATTWPKTGQKSAYHAKYFNSQKVLY